eukprot:6193631-Pleurochrysis_carterae.AAC.6
MPQTCRYEHSQNQSLVSHAAGLLPAQIAVYGCTSSSADTFVKCSCLCWSDQLRVWVSEMKLFQDCLGMH